MLRGPTECGLGPEALYPAVVCSQARTALNTLRAQVNALMLTAPLWRRLAPARKVAAVVPRKVAAVVPRIGTATAPTTAKRLKPSLETTEICEIRL